MPFSLSNMSRVFDTLPNNYQIMQDTDLYRFTSDSVLLSSFVRAKAHEKVADFCAGSGIVGLHFLATNEIESLTFVEAQSELATLCRENVALNNLSAEVVERKVQDLDSSYAGKFSLILCNPPYEKAGFSNRDDKKAICRKEILLTFPELAKSASKCLKYGGRFVFCHRADRLAELIYTVKSVSLEPKRIQFVTGKEGDKPYLLLMECTKGGKEGVEIMPNLVNTER